VWSTHGGKGKGCVVTADDMSYHKVILSYTYTSSSVQQVEDSHAGVGR
jgi:hypothetical protein